MLTISPQDMQAVVLSLKVAGTATLMATPVGIAAAYALVFSRVPGKAILEGIINLPLVLPPVVVGYLLLLAFGSNGVLGSLFAHLDIRIIFTWLGAVIASGVVGFPLLVRSARIGMELVDPSLVKVSRTLGAGRLDSFFTIILPLSGRGVFAGMMLMFARSLGEFGATIILAGNIPGVTQTIPLAIYEYTSTPGGDRVALSLCLVSVALSFGVLLLSEAAARVLKRS